jgi:hypothetical protein
MELRNIFVGIDLGDKNSVARIAVDRGKAERYGFVNNAQGRAGQSPAGGVDSRQAST